MSGRNYYTTDAIVLRLRKYRESDGLLVLLTRKLGKVHAVAKGIFKPKSSLRGGTQLLTLNFMQLYESKTLYTVTQSECHEAFLPLHDQLDSMVSASCWAELLEALLPDALYDEALFDMALSGFYALSLDASPITRLGLEAQLMNYLGYKPILDRCADCLKDIEKESRIYFSSEIGGIVCGKCKSVKDPVISKEAAALWQGLGRINFSKISRIKGKPEVVKQLDGILEIWISAQTGKPLKSWSVIKTMGGIINE